MSDPLDHLAEHDLLTGVYNRSRLVSELDRQLSFSARYARAGALFATSSDTATTPRREPKQLDDLWGNISPARSMK